MAGRSTKSTYPDEEIKKVKIFVSEYGAITLIKDNENIVVQSEIDEEDSSIFEKNAPYLFQLITNQLPEYFSDENAEISWGSRQVKIEHICILEEDIIAFRIYSEGKKVSEGLYDDEGYPKIIDGASPDGSTPSITEQFENSIGEALDWLVNG